MSLLDTASLIVTPNGYKEGKLYSVIPSDGNGDLSVTRATTATRVNSAGLVELVPYNYKVQSENLTLGVGLDDANITTITANTTETLDPFGGYNAEKYNGSTNQSADTYNFIPQNSVVTSSVYVKAGTATSFTLRLNASFGTFAFATFDLTNGTITGTGTDGFAYISSAVTAVGNGWYRCSLTYNFLSFPTNRILLSQNGSIYVFGWQLVEGSTAKDYQKTETRLNIPRLDYSNGTCPSLLVEPQRTNILTYSSSFDNAAWTPQTISVSANATTSPDGTTTAETLTPSGSGAYDNRVYQTHSVTSGAVYTLSVWAKSSASNAKLTLGLQNHGGQVFSITNEWERYSVAVTALSTGGNFNIYAGDVTPTTGVVNSSNVVTIWGAQLEAGSYATSYIPTTSASVTRNADVISKTGISSLIGQTEGTLFCDVLTSSIELGDYQTFVSVYGNGNNRVVIGKEQGTSNLFYYVNSNGSVTFQIITKPLGSYKIALAYKNGDSCLYINGVSVFTTSNAVNFSTTLTDFYINQRPTGFEIGTLNMNSAALWTTRLTNDQLTALTTL